MTDQITIVAEAAQGYEGDPTIGRLLAKAAARAGADMVKFQIIYADELASPSYQHYALFRQLEMADGSWRAIADEAGRAGVGLAFDVYGARSLALALALGAAAVKIHATDFFNHALVQAALAGAPRMFLSAGGIELGELTAFFERHRGATEKTTLFYGFQAEPTATADNHLARLTSLRAAFPDLALGFMDHSAGDAEEAGWLGMLAVPLGVRAIEKHLSLDRALELEDFVSALAPAEFSKYVARVRAAEAAVGRPALELGPAERAYRRRAVKVVVAAHALDAGAVLRDRDVALLRTSLDADRDPLYKAEEVAGRTLRSRRSAGEAIYVDDLA